MGFVKVASAGMLGPAQKLGVEAGGRKILLTNIDGPFYAIGDYCTHLSCFLSDGQLRGENIQCSCHGSIFNVKTGAVIKGPAKKPEMTYQVKVDGDQVMVNI